MSSSVSLQPQAQTAGFELEQIEIYGKYMLSTPIDVLFVLRSMIKRNCTATVYFDQGKSFFLTWILALTPDEKNLVLDPASDAGINRLALRAPRLTVTANLDSVKIQFQLKGLKEASHEGRPALIGPVPSELLRLQRREYFRLVPPVADPLHCHVPVRGSDGSSVHTQDLTLADISGGGLGLMVPSNSGEYFQPGTVFKDCRLQLPEENAMAVALKVCSIFPVTTKSGYTFLRAGCEFVGLTGARLTIILRYITRIERERKAKLSRLD